MVKEPQKYWCGSGVFGMFSMIVTCIFVVKNGAFISDRASNMYVKHLRTTFYGAGFLAYLPITDQHMALINYVINHWLYAREPQ